MLKHRRTTTPTKELGFSTSQSNAVSTTKRSSSVPPKLDRSVGSENMANNSERSLVSVRASVVVYDDIYKKWIPSGDFPSGISKVQIYHEPINRTYRVIGRKIQDKEVTLNTMISGGIKYSEATPTFHQWRDSHRAIHGLNFSSKEDAATFSKCMLAVLRLLQHSSAVSGCQPERVTPIDQQLHIEVPVSQQTQNSQPNDAGHGNLLLSGSSSSHQIGSNGGHVQNNYHQEPRGSYSESNQHYSDYATLPTVNTNNIYRSADRPQVSTYSTNPPTSTHSTKPYTIHPQVYQQPNHNNNYHVVAANGVQPIQQYQPYKSLSQLGSESNPGLSSYHNGYSELSDRCDGGIYSTVGSVVNSEYSTSFQPLSAHHNSSQPLSAHHNSSQQGLPDVSVLETTELTSAPPPPPPPPAPPIPAGGIPSLPKSTSISEMSSQAYPMSSLAAAIQATTLKKTPKVEASGIPPPLVGAKAVLMEEMQRKLAKRKAKVDGEDVSSTNCSATTSPFQTIRSNTSSPKPFVKPVPKQGSVGDCASNGLSSETLPCELQQLKQELLIEIRKDIQQFKSDVLRVIQEESLTRAASNH